MQLVEIDKEKYKKRFWVVFAAIVVVLLIVGLGSSTLAIQMFGTPGETHFWFNLGGVVIAAFVAAFLLKRLRTHPYMREVVYVWDLKQQLNRIHRKVKNVEAAAEENDPDALVALNYYYRGSKQLYELDDNTITMDTLGIKLSALERKMKDLGMDMSTDSYRPEILERF